MRWAALAVLMLGCKGGELLPCADGATRAKNGITCEGGGDTFVPEDTSFDTDTDTGTTTKGGGTGDTAGDTAGGTGSDTGDSSDTGDTSPTDTSS